MECVNKKTVLLLTCTDNNHFYCQCNLFVVVVVFMLVFYLIFYLISKSLTVLR